MRDDSTLRVRRNWLNSLKERTSAFSLVNSKFWCIKNKDKADSDEIKCKRLRHVTHFRDCLLYKEPSVKDERIKVTEVMEYET